MLNLILPQANPAIETNIQVRQELNHLAAEGRLAERLVTLDSRVGRPLQRIFIMGCGRSGTWLLTALMATFSDVHLEAKELPVEFFGLAMATESTLVIKRNFKSHERVEAIPPNIKILYILRHPFDVLTSVNPVQGDEDGYYIKPMRWLAEMLALQYLVDTGRSNTLVVTYEELVGQPAAVQRRIADFFGLDIAQSPDAIAQFDAPQEASLAMHGVRAIDQQSMFKYRRDPGKIAYLQGIKPRLGRLLDWVAEHYGYDTSL